ncbi:hypothetical protein OG455_03165 [Kitasatospora sp. NBC_01287]|uniref:hypothetical protein n=1 Tax=Kitasatospora sp. NBC_01287 TaxID=2903573 RepID=UPI002257B686|nr:hypothetical protein [Kitasatospora sp. NBC_01287]MCX4744528.1 hypothetical protein [Kitasatospora sp. NBC_01287]
MIHCAATGAIVLDGRIARVVCDRTPHDLSEEHNDAVLGDWSGAPGQQPET